VTATKTEVACRACGVATTERVTQVPRSTPAGRPMPPYDVGVCDGCADLGLDEPGSAVRAALRVIHKPEKDWPLAAEAFAEAGVDVAPALYERATPQRRPWGHVPREVRDALKAAYLRVLDAKVFAAAATEGRPVPPAGPPDDAEYPGCLYCGLGRQAEPWRGPVTTTALRKPGMVTGYLCSPCAEATEAVGAVGATALERAVMAHHGLDWTEDVRIPRLRAAVAEGEGPSGTPWSWVDLREPVDAGVDPVALLRKEVADLAARVAALEGP
jgi:hypothetical protein